MVHTKPGSLLVPGRVGEAGDKYRAIIRASSLAGLITLMNDENIGVSQIMEAGYDSSEGGYYCVYKVQ